MYLSEFKKYRSVAMQKITNNQKIVDLITGTNNSSVSPQSLVGKNIFPYEYLPGTTEEGKTCISMLMSAPFVDNRSILEMKIVLYVFTYEDLVWTKDDSGMNCLRVDLICEEIDKMFNGSDDFGLKLQLVSRRDGYQPGKKFHGTQLVYATKDFNYKV